MADLSCLNRGEEGYFVSDDYPTADTQVSQVVNACAMEE
jgi:hypothetical protein